MATKIQVKDGAVNSFFVGTEEYPKNSLRVTYGKEVILTSIVQPEKVIRKFRWYNAQNASNQDYASYAAFKTAFSGLAFSVPADEIDSDQISDATAVGKGVLTAADAAAARTAIGNYTGATVDIAAGTDGLAAGTLQATIQGLITRVKALEDAV